VAATTKQALLLLTTADEVEFTQAIAAQVPEVKFLDFEGWRVADEPPVCESILDCGLAASIWNPLIVPSLLTSSRSDGKLIGPQIGPVIQWLRCRESDSRVLQSGRLAASCGESSPQQLASFIEQVWKVLSRMTDNRLQRIQERAGEVTALGAERRFRVGPNASALASTGSLVLLSGKMRLAPEDSIILSK
jgi:hypothetical protein